MLTALAILLITIFSVILLVTTSEFIFPEKVKPLNKQYDIYLVTMEVTYLNRGHTSLLRKNLRIPVRVKKSFKENEPTTVIKQVWKSEELTTLIRSYDVYNIKHIETNQVNNQQ